ncbi:MAG: ROK family protein [Xenococcaceae cyanobacterium MO_207.B15]|nr:ROK family protein [Xenococcaceae cyanobacterium MO_207.B15]
MINVLTPEVIGIDIGGTTISIGCFMADGTCTESVTVATPKPAIPEAVVNEIAPVIKQLQQQHNCLAIGVGMPGPTDDNHRIAKIAINLPGWNHNVPLADWLEAETNLVTTVENDANCAAVGEFWLGVGRNFNNFILLTLGTGVGGAIFIDGKLFTGGYGAAGELGLITLYPEGYPCNSGNRGSLEQYCSITAIIRETGQEPVVLGKLAENGDKEAIAFWEKYGTILGTGLASLMYVLTPEAIIIGGGISASSKYFLPATLAEIETRVTPTSRLGLQLLTAQLGNSAGMLGAAKLAWDLLGKNDVTTNK